MTEAEWLACTEPKPMLEFLRGTATDRKLRLFGCAVVRRIWASLPDLNTQEAVEVAELYADGHATVADMATVWQHGYRSYKLVQGTPTSRVSAAFATAVPPPDFEPGRIASLIALHVAWVTKHEVSIDHAESAAQSILLRDIFGNPFTPSPPLPPAVLGWNDGTIPRIAQGIYDDRKMPEGTLDNGRIAILADALLDAGCDDEALIPHCREPGTHVRGCWAIDLILGKE